MLNGSGAKPIVRLTTILFALFGLAAGALAQNATLSIGSASATAGGTVSVPITLTSSGGAQTSALQWTFSYSSDITGVTVIPAPSATNAGKLIDCSGSVCIVYGVNSTVIPDGTVATAMFQISANPSTSGIPVALNTVVDSSATGSSIPAGGGAGVITTTGSTGVTSTGSPPGGLATLSCAPSTMGSNLSSACTVSLTQAAANATVVTLGSNNPLVSVPSFVTIGAGQSGASFSAHTGTVASAQTATVSATLGAATVLTSISLQVGMVLVGSMPHVVADGGWTTTFTLVNKSSSPVETLPTFLSDSGGPLLLFFTLPQFPAAGTLFSAMIDQTLGANASFVVDASGPATTPFVEGSAQITAAGSVDGFAIFHFDPSEQEAAVPLETRNASSYILAFDNTNGVLTGVAVENISTSAAVIPVILRDDTGAQVGTGSVSLPPSGHTSFVLATQFPVTANLRGTVELDTPSGGQMGVLGIRYTPLGTITTIPALANVGTNGGSMAHIASASGWETTFVLVNTGTSAAQAVLSFYDDNGNPLVLPLSVAETGETESVSLLTETVAPGALLSIQSTGQPTDPLQEGSAQLTTTGNVSGFVILRYNPNGQEAVVPLESRGANGYLLAFDNTNGTATGVALNIVTSQAVSSQPANVPVVVRDDSGAAVATGSIQLAANGHYSGMLSTLFPATAGIRGTVEFDAPSGGAISVVGIRSPPALTFTTLPSLTK